MGIRERAKEILNANIPEGRVFYSNGASAKEFTRLTAGYTHEQLVQNWSKGGQLTCCMGFVQWYGYQLGAKINLGQFTLPKPVIDIGKGDAWVKSSKGPEPKYGDILLHTGVHIDVALDIDKAHILHRVAAGQGRVGQRDILCRVKGAAPFDFRKLQGWIDIERYFESGAATAPNPSWLVGWWKVTWRGQAFYYLFDRGSQVRWTQAPPSHPAMPLNVPRDTGNVATEAPATVTIRWGASGSEEKLALLPTDTATLGMEGTWNDTEKLTAVKI